VRVSIKVHCQCGHAFRVKDKYAGSKGKCPRCGEMVRVPGETPGIPMPPGRKPMHKPPASERRHLARVLARQLSPKSLPNLPALEVAGMCQPSKDPGHDYHDCLQLHDGSWAALIGTINARSLDAATSAVQLRAATHALVLGYSDPGVILTLLNRVFVADWPENRSATMVLVRYDPQSRYLSYASAGHPTAYVLDAQGSVKWNLESTDCPLGLLAHTMYGASTPLRLEPGEAVVMLSDGLLKSAAAEGFTPGPARLLQALGGAMRLPARTMVGTVEQMLKTDTTRPLSTDRTVLVLKAR
jgi:serine phosphatase RsbU (regulator of sigma subunit)